MRSILTCPVGRHCGSWYGIHMKWELQKERLVVYLTSGIFHQSIVADRSLIQPNSLRVETSMLPRRCYWGKNDATGTASLVRRIKVNPMQGPARRKSLNFLGQQQRRKTTIRNHPQNVCHWISCLLHRLWQSSRNLDGKQEHNSGL